MKTSLFAIISFIFISHAYAALPNLPHSGAVLLDLATRSPVEIDAIQNLDANHCSKTYQPIEITQVAHLKIGNEIYDAKKWFCVSEHADGNLNGFAIQYEHPEFHVQVSLNVYPGKSSIVENHAVRPLIITSANSLHD